MKLSWKLQLTIAFLFIAAFAIQSLSAVLRPQQIPTAQTRNSRAILSIPPPAPDHRIQYGSGPQQFGELRLPKGPGPFPVAVIIHGGCWMAEYGLGYMGHMSASLTRDGIATWSIEYRRVGDPGGGWPGTFQDAAAGVDYLRELAKKYPLDLSRVVATGHSAGGHLVLWLAARQRLPEDNPGYAGQPLALRGVIALAALTDLRRNGTACDDSIKSLMGGSDFEQPSRYNQSSPINLLPLKIRQTLIHGDADRIVPPDMVRDYALAARKKGEIIDLVIIEKAGHFELVDPESFAWPRVREEILKLLKKSTK